MIGCSARKPETRVRVLEIVPGCAEIAELLRDVGHGDVLAFGVVLDLLAQDEIDLTHDLGGAA